MGRTGSIKLTLKSQSVENNNSVVAIEGLITTTDGSYRGDYRTGTYKVYQNGTAIKSGSFTHGAAANATTVLFTDTVTVTHNAEGEAGVITADYNYDAGWCTGAGSLSVPRISRASTLTVADGTLGSGQTLKVNSTNTKFKHQLYYGVGAYANIINPTYILGSATSFSSETEKYWVAPIDLAAKETVGSTVTLTFVLTTFLDGSYVGSNTYTRTFKIPETLVPDVAIGYEDANGYKAKYGGFVRNVSRLKFTISIEEAQGAGITSCSTKVGNKSYEGTSFTTDVITARNSISVSNVVTDTRGRSKTTAFDIGDILEYATPTLSRVSVKRDSTGNNLVVTFSSSITPLNNKNTAKYTVEYKKKNVTAFSSPVEVTAYTGNYAVSSGTYSFAAETDSSYDVRLTAIDAFNSTPVVAVGPTISVFCSRWKRGLGVAFGKIAEVAETFDVGWKAIFRKGITLPENFLYLTGTGEQDIVFENCGSTGWKTAFYKGAATSSTAIGLYDSTNQRNVWAYGTDGNFKIYRPTSISNSVTVSDASVILRNTGTGTYGFNTYKTVDSVEHRGYFGWSSSGNSIWKKYNAGTQKNYISMSDTNVYFYSSANISEDNYLYFGTGFITQDADTNLKFSPTSGAANAYRILLGKSTNYTLCPMTSGNYELGNSSFKWKQLYANTTTISTSDRNDKFDIENVDLQKASDFINALSTKTFKFKNGESGRTHWGMVAQEVEDVMTEQGISDMDFAGFIRFQKEHIETKTKIVVDEETGVKEEREYEEFVKDYDENGNPVYGYGLRYEEFIAPMIATIQKQQMEINELRAELSEIKSKLNL